MSLDYFTSSEDVNMDILEQFSDTFYPDLYCGCVEASEKACYEQNILELWGDQVCQYTYISTSINLRYQYNPSMKNGIHSTKIFVVKFYY